jgi:hypothetical protein
MRNLKRVLSLALASVMLLGMMAIGASAADTTYSDQSSITKVEAAAVMSAVGVFQGSDGKFSPTSALTRETAAKIITYMVMGKSAADDLKASSAPFTDVAADRWSAGSIAYCVANGIVAGDGQGHFYPEVTVTGIQFGKMLLVALGYNATTEGYVGSGYEVNIAKQINSLKLASGVGVGMSSVLNREQAAQMALNAIQKSLVEYVGGTNVTLPDGTTVISGGTRQNVKDGDGKVVTFMSNYMSSLKKSTSGEEAFGRPAHQWKYGATSVGVYGDSADITYTDKTKESVIKSDLSGYDTAAVVVSVDGVDAAAATLTNAQIAALTGNGTTVEIYTTQDAAGDYEVSNIVVINTWLAQITNINTVSKTVSLSVKNSTAKTVKNDDDSALYTQLAAMAKDDYVLITVADGAVKSAVEPETVTGGLTSITKDSTYVIAGTTYKASAKADVSNLKTGTSFIVYLDAQGNLIYAAEETTTSAKYAYVVADDKVGSNSNGWTYMVKLVFDDATQEWVDLASVNSVGVKDSSFATEWAKVTSMNTSGAIGGFVGYSVKTDGSYALTTYAAAANIPTSGTSTSSAITAYKIPAGAAVKKSTVNFLNDGTNDYDVVGTSKTIFLVKSGNDTYKAYTGITNVANLSGVTGQVLVAKNSKTASIVVVTTSTATAKDLVYILSAKASEGYDDDLGASVYTYDAIIKGEVTTITTVAKTVTGTAGGTALAKGLYTIDSYSGDYAKTLTAIAAPANEDSYYRYGDGITMASGTVTVAGSGKSFVLADDCVILAVNSDDEAAIITDDDVEYYDTVVDGKGNEIKDVVITLDSDGFASSIIFQYVEVK